MSAKKNNMTLVSRAVSRIKIARAKKRVQKAFEAGITELTFGPWSINLIMADTCNSCCIMCGRDYHGSGSGRTLTLDNVKTVYGNLPMNYVHEVIYGGGGEPFMNHEIAEIAEYTREISPTIQHTVISNMIYAPQDACRRLLEKRVHFLISVNAATGETFKEVSGTDDFTKAIENIRRLVSLKKETKSSSGISLSIVLMRKNMHEMPSFVKLAGELGVSSVKFLYVRIYPENIRRKTPDGFSVMPKDSTYFHQAESDSYVRKAKDEAKKLGINFSGDPLYAESVNINRNCMDPWQYLFVNYNGNAYPCPASEVLFREKIEKGTYDSGNILKQELMEFWNNDFWRQLRRTNAAKDRREIVPECLCCGNSIRWCGAKAKRSHILDWSTAEESDLSL